MAEFAINTWQDRQLEDGELFNQFLNFWRNNEYQKALNILSDNAQLSTKSLTAGVLNTISAALVYLQDNYFENVEDVLAQELDRFNIAISHFINQHLYIPTKQYYPNNFVLYNDFYYLCIKDSLGNSPTDVNYWVEIGLKGEKGSSGTGLNLKYSWNSSTQYNQYDVVYLSGVLYVALQPNSNQNPRTAIAYWQVFMVVPKTSITISRMKPVDSYEGQIWFRLMMGAYTWQEVNDKGYTFENINEVNVDWEFVNGGGW